MIFLKRDKKLLYYGYQNISNIIYRRYNIIDACISKDYMHLNRVIHIYQ